MNGAEFIITVKTIAGVPQRDADVAVYAGNSATAPVATGSTDEQGNAYLSIASPQGAYVARQTVPTGFLQQTPASNLGVHFPSVVADNEYTASFVNEPAPVSAPAPTTSTTTPPATQPVASPASGFVLGFNAPYQSAAVIQQAASAMAQFKSRLARFFVGSISTAAINMAIYVAGHYALEGISCLPVLNFGGKVPANWVEVLNAIPNASQNPTVIGWEIGNEIDTAAYFTDTAANYAIAFKQAVNILHAKGYKKVIVGNVTTWGAGSAGQKLYEAFQTLGVFAVADGAGGHFYMNNAQQSISVHKALIAWLAALGVPYYCTEFGLHGGSDWAAQITLLMAWAITVNATFVYFCLQQFTPASHASPEAPFNADWSQNVPFFAAVKAGLT